MHFHIAKNAIQKISCRRGVRKGLLVPPTARAKHRAITKAMKGAVQRLETHLDGCRVYPKTVVHVTGIGMDVQLARPCGLGLAEQR